MIKATRAMTQQHLYRLQEVDNARAERQDLIERLKLEEEEATEKLNRIRARLREIGGYDE